MNTALVGGLLFVEAVGLAYLARKLSEMERERDIARAGLAAELRRRAGAEHAQHLITRWHESIEGREFTDGEEVAGSLADFFAQHTGETIVARQANGDGIIIAIPNVPADD